MDFDREDSIRNAVEQRINNRQHAIENIYLLLDSTKNAACNKIHAIVLKGPMVSSVFDEIAACVEPIVEIEMAADRALHRMHRTLMRLDQETRGY